jgi:hypothetical protein
MARSSTITRRPRLTAAARRRMSQRRELWPEVKDSQLWDRTEFTGFTTIPRTLSLIMRIIDDLDRKNAGRVYFDLWCRSFDDYVIEVRDEFEAAFSSGYDGQRAIRSWRERIAILEGFGFIKAYKASHGAYRMILVLDPHPIVERLHKEKEVPDEDWLALRALMISIGQLAK